MSETVPVQKIYDMQDHVINNPAEPGEVIDAVDYLKQLLTCDDPDGKMLEAVKYHLKKLGGLGQSVYDFIVTRNPTYKNFEPCELSNISEADKHSNQELIGLGFVPSQSMSKGYLFEDVNAAVKKLKFMKAGFYTHKGKLCINANKFVVYFHSVFRLKMLLNGSYILYHRCGVYKFVDNLVIAKLCRDLMNDACKDSWTIDFEREVLRAIMLSSELEKDIDKHENLINFKNCILDLETRVTYDHSPDFFMTTQLNFNYDPEAVATRFRLFMQEITCFDKKLEAVLQESLADAIIPSKKSEKAVFYRGGGKNAKSVLARTLTKLVGEDNVSNIPLSEFNEKFGLSNILGKKLNIAYENEMNGASLNSEKVKAIASGDRLSVNIKYRKAVETKLPTKLIFLVNSLPDSKDVTYGFIRKMLIIPFNAKFEGENCDVHLEEKLEVELPGIFNYIMEGIKRFKDNGYTYSQCDAVDEIMRSYYLSINPVFNFVEEAMEYGDEDLSVPKKTVVEAYTNWCHENGLDSPRKGSNQTFWSQFKSACSNTGHKYQEKKVKGYHHLRGFAIKEDYQLKPTEVIFN